MSDKERFVAKIIEPVKKKKTNIIRAPQIPAFNLNKINMRQIAEDLSKITSRSSSRSFIGKIFSNFKLNLDNETLSRIQDYVNRVIGINESITEVQYRLFIAPKVLEEMIQGHYIEAERKAELQFEQHELEITRLRAEKEKAGLELDRINAEIDHMREDLKRIQGTNKIIEVRGRILERIEGELDFNNITPSQAFVLIKALNPDASADVDFASRELVINEQIDRMKAETAKVREETRTKKYQADLDEHKKDEQIKRDKEV